MLDWGPKVTSQVHPSDLHMACPLYWNPSKSIFPTLEGAEHAGINKKSMDVDRTGRVAALTLPGGGSQEGLRRLPEVSSPEGIRPTSSRNRIENSKSCSKYDRALTVGKLYRVEQGLLLYEGELRGSEGFRLTWRKMLLSRPWKLVISRGLLILTLAFQHRFARWSCHLCSIAHLYCLLATALHAWARLSLSCLLHACGPWARLVQLGRIHDYLRVTLKIGWASILPLVVCTNLFLKPGYLFLLHVSAVAEMSQWMSEVSTWGRAGHKSGWGSSCSHLSHCQHRDYSPRPMWLLILCLIRMQDMTILWHMLGTDLTQLNSLVSTKMTHRWQPLSIWTAVEVSWLKQSTPTCTSQSNMLCSHLIHILLPVLAWLHITSTIRLLCQLDSRKDGWADSMKRLGQYMCWSINDQSIASSQGELSPNLQGLVSWSSFYRSFAYLLTLIVWRAQSNSEVSCINTLVSDRKLGLL